jgi:predicted transcriptional regulator
MASKRVVTFKLTEQLDDALTKLARQRGESRSALVREAVAAFTVESPHSVTAAVDALVGTVDGPRDLSTNAKYLAGYGE